MRTLILMMLTVSACSAQCTQWLMNPYTGKLDCSASSTSGTGNVVGPATNTDLYIPQWNGANSKTLKDGLPVAQTATASTLAQRNSSGEVIAANTVATGKTPLATDGDATNLTNIPVNQAKSGAALPVANGGTGSAFFTVAGPASTAKTFTFPNANATVSYTVASGAKALATGAISSAACTTAQTDTATGTLTTDVVTASFNGDPTGVTGYVPLTTGMLTIIPYPTADTVNFKVCNNTSASITPGAITLNWRVVR